MISDIQKKGKQKGTRRKRKNRESTRKAENLGPQK